MTQRMKALERPPAKQKDAVLFILTTLWENGISLRNVSGIMIRGFILGLP